MPTPQFDIQNVLKRAQNLDISTQFQPYSGVEIVTGAQDEDGHDIPPHFAGDTSGRVLTIYNEWGTQEQAENILASIRGFAYQPYVASGALVDPNAELGDGVSVNDVYSGIYKMSRNFSSLMAADIEAPQSEEIDHEYPYESSGSRKTTRKFSAMESRLSINSNEIEAKVSIEGGSSQSVSWNLTAQDWSVYANGNRVFRVTSMGAEVTGRITATSGKIGGFTINENESNAIQYNGLTWNGNKQGIFLGTQGIQLGSRNGSYFQASASGDVRAHNLTLTGNLNMGGVSITPQNLANRANSAYTSTTSGGYCYNASAGWNNATGTTAGFNGNFTAKNIIAKNRCDAPYMTVSASFNASGTFNVGGIAAYWKEVTISGVKIRYLGRD